MKTLSIFLCFICSLSGEEVILDMPTPSGDNSALPSTLARVGDSKSYVCVLKSTDTVLVEIADIYSKRVVFLDRINDENTDSKTSLNFEDLTFYQMYSVILEPLGYRFKEFEDGLVVVAKRCEGETQKGEGAGN